MPWPEDDPIFQAQVYKKVVFDSEPAGCFSKLASLFFLIVIIDILQAFLLDNAPVIPALFEFCKKHIF